MNLNDLPSRSLSLSSAPAACTPPQAVDGLRTEFRVAAAKGLSGPSLAESVGVPATSELVRQLASTPAGERAERIAGWIELRWQERFGRCAPADVRGQLSEQLAGDPKVDALLRKLQP